MARHPEDRLWAFAGGELGEHEHVQLQAHLERCPRCAQKLDAVRAARQSLEAARAAPGPAVDWQRVTDGLDQNLRAPARSSIRWAAAAGVLALAAAILVFVWAGRGPNAPAVPGAPIATASTPRSPPVSFAEVESATDANAAGGALIAGTKVVAGDTIRTGRAGRARLRLPDNSELVVLEEAALVIDTASAEAVVLGVEAGRLVVLASHAPRQQFVVTSGTVSVRVVGTLFTVARDEGVTSVAVAEGKVQVEWPQGSRGIGAGERVAIDANGAVVETLADAERTAAVAALAPAADGAPPSVQANEAGPAPRSQRRPPTGAPPPGAPPFDAPPIITVRPPAEVEVGPPAESPAPSWSAGDAVASAPRPDLQDSDATLLATAERSLGGGRRCMEYLAPLGELADRSRDVNVGGRARILRARCYAELLDWERALREFERYVGDHPAGEFVREAQRALDR